MQEMTVGLALQGRFLRVLPGLSLSLGGEI